MLNNFMILVGPNLYGLCLRARECVYVCIVNEFECMKRTMRHYCVSDCQVVYFRGLLNVY